MKKVYYKKLIRDKIPDKIINKGSKLETKKAEQQTVWIGIAQKSVRRGEWDNQC
jgi:predicted house-cleaning noncanonical NTP pyrophosphatase (MazG superfamily)